MIRLLILYYINIKPTHGYEIQKFLQVSGIENWGKIQSGSIYYALTKLEKEKAIEVVREERTGARVRKIYQITESGRKELLIETKSELGNPITNIGSLKFVTYPLVSNLSSEEIVKLVNLHIDAMLEQKEYWCHWQKLKGDQSPLTKISFEMTVSSLEYQIQWHRELLTHLEQYKQEANEFNKMIATVDFSELDEQDVLKEEEDELNKIVKLKDDIMKDPARAIQDVEKMIEEMKRKKK